MSDPYYDDDFGYPNRSRSKLVIGIIVVVILVIAVAVVVLVVIPGLRSSPPCTEANTPLIQELTASPKIVPIGRRSTLTVLASDPTGAALTYVWTATDGELRLPSGAPAQGPVPNSTVDLVAPDYTTDVVVTVVVKNTECSVATRIKIPVVLGPTPTPVPSETPTPTSTSTPTPIPTLTPTSTPTPTPTPRPIVNTESITGWRPDLANSNGEESANKMILVPGRTGKAIGISYDVGDGGYVLITKNLAPEVLSGTTGISFFYRGSGVPNTIELKLMLRYPGDEDDTTYGVEWNSATNTENRWTQFQVYYSDFTCWWPEQYCSRYGDLPDLRMVDRLDFAVSNKPGDVTGSGEVAFDDVWGIQK